MESAAKTTLDYFQVQKLHQTSTQLLHNGDHWDYNHADVDVCNDEVHMAWPGQLVKILAILALLSDPCAHGVQSLGRTLCLYLSIYETFLKPCEDLVNTVNVVNVDPSC